MGGVTRLILLLFAVAAGLATSAPARSGDFFKDTANGVAVDWSGLYAGVHGGYGWSNVDTGIANVHVDGWMGGVHLGLQRQFDRWVIGIEGSYSFGELDGHRTLTFAGNPLRLDAAISDLLLVTGRLGYAWNDRLLYVKAGYAAADVEIGATSFGVTTQARSRLDGWTAGFGLERMLTPNLVIGLEYNYVDLGSKSLGATVILNGAAPAAIVNPYVPNLTKIDPDSIHTVFARLSYKFGGPPAEHVPYK